MKNKEKDKSSRHVLRSTRVPFSSGIRVGGGCYTVEARWAHATVSLANKIYVFGGQGENTIQNTCFYDASTSVWNECNTVGKAPIPRQGHSATLVNNDQVVLFGGKGKKFLNDLYVLNLRTMTWRTIQNVKNLPDARAAHTATFVGQNKIYILGGYSAHKYHSSLYMMTLGKNGDEDAITCTKLTNIPGAAPSYRSAHTANYVAERNMIIVYGGFDGKKSLDDMYMLEFTGGGSIRWHHIKPGGIGPSPRHGHTAVVVGGRYLVIHGGFSTKSPDNFLNDVHAFDLEQLTWVFQPTITGFPLFPRFHHSANLLDSNEMIIFGGCAAGTLYSDLCSVDLKSFLHQPQQQQQQQQQTQQQLTNLNQQEVETNNLTIPTSTSTQTHTTTTSTIDQSSNSLISNSPSALPENNQPIQTNNQSTIDESKVKVLENQLFSTLSLLTTEQKQKSLISEEFNKLKMLNIENELKLSELSSKNRTLEKENQRIDLIIKKDSNFKVQTKDQLSKLNSSVKEKENQLQLFYELFSQFKLKDQINLVQVPSLDKRDNFSNLLKSVPGSGISSQQQNNQPIIVNNSQIVQSQPTVPPVNPSAFSQQQEIEELKLKLKNANDKIEQFQSANKSISDRFPKLNVNNIMGESLNDLDPEDLEKLEELYHSSLRKVGKAKQVQLERKMKQENESNSDRCTICLDRRITVVFLPCRHRCTCSDCSSKIETCPLCRANIQDHIEYY